MKLRSRDVARLANELFVLDKDEGAGATSPDSGLVGVSDASTPVSRSSSRRYRVLDVLGAGGMGEVYEAEQQNPRRRVALKVVRPGLITAEARRRFEHEISVLGSLQHRSIAQIYEAGHLADLHLESEPDATHPIGRLDPTTPYFAMEFVAGRPLIAHAQQHQLGVRARLELFLKVCDAVSHAHQRGVIHRDLKPSNILITGTGADGAEGVDGPGGGEPKILDFGIARATDADIAATTIHTQVGQLLGTLPYMSPEQASGNPALLDTRSDVYSLGVILYELLSGKLPLAMSASSVPEALRLITEQDPALLGTHDRSFRGDLEAITAKALEKDRERRYQSVAEFVADIKRHLNNEPIIARPAGAWYQARKFTRRNRPLVAGVALLAVTTALLAWLLVREAAARSEAETARQGEKQKSELAERRARHNEAVAVFLHSTFLAANPKYHGRTVKVIDLFPIALDHMEKELIPSQPAVAASLASSIGLGYLGMGEDERAREVFEKSVKWWRMSGDADPVGALQTDLYLVRSVQEKQPLEKTLAEMLVVQENAQRRLDAKNSFLPTIATDLAITYRKLGRLDEAEKLARSVLDFRVEDEGPESMVALDAAINLGAIIEFRGRPDEAEVLYRKALDSLLAQYGERHATTMQAMGSLARISMHRKRFKEALPLLWKVYETTLELHGPESSPALVTQVNLSRALFEVGNYDDGEPLANDVLEKYTTKFGPSSLDTSGAMELVAFYKGARGEDAEAEKMLKAAYAIQREKLSPTHPRVFSSTAGLGDFYFRTERYEEAIEWYRKALAILETLKDAGTMRHAYFLRTLGESHTKLSQLDEAEKYLKQAEAIVKEKAPPNVKAPSEVYSALAELYRQKGDAAEADRYDALAKEAAKPTPK